MVFSNDIPFPEFIEVQTIKKFHRGMAHNGIHEGREVTIDVYLDIYQGRSKISCRSCGADVKPGDICGDGNYKGEGVHCANCVTLPPTVEGWEITYKMKRKSRQHPSGFRSIAVANYPNVITDYMQELSNLFGVVILKRLYPKCEKVCDELKYIDGLQDRKCAIISHLKTPRPEEETSELLSELVEIQGKLDEGD
jgi:hypothetical protein